MPSQHVHWHQLPSLSFLTYLLGSKQFTVLIESSHVHRVPTLFSDRSKGGPIQSLSLTSMLGVDEEPVKVDFKRSHRVPKESEPISFVSVLLQGLNNARDSSVMDIILWKPHTVPIVLGVVFKRPSSPVAAASIQHSDRTSCSSDGHFFCGKPLIFFFFLNAICCQWRRAQVDRKGKKMKGGRSG